MIHWLVERKAKVKRGERGREAVDRLVKLVAKVNSCDRTREVEDRKVEGAGEKEKREVRGEGIQRFTDCIAKNVKFTERRREVVEIV